MSTDVLRLFERSVQSQLLRLINSGRVLPWPLTLGSRTLAGKADKGEIEQLDRNSRFTNGDRYDLFDLLPPSVLVRERFCLQST